MLTIMNNLAQAYPSELRIPHLENNAFIYGQAPPRPSLPPSPPSAVSFHAEDAASHLADELSVRDSFIPARFSPVSVLNEVPVFTKAHNKTFNQSRKEPRPRSVKPRRPQRKCVENLSPYLTRGKEFSRSKRCRHKRPKDVFVQKLITLVDKHAERCPDLHFEVEKLRAEYAYLLNRCS